MSQNVPCPNAMKIFESRPVSLPSHSRLTPMWPAPVGAGRGPSTAGALYEAGGGSRDFYIFIFINRFLQSGSMNHPTFDYSYSLYSII